jgi:hypothetical protein
MPNEFDKGMIANQLQNAGVLEAIRVTRVTTHQSTFKNVKMKVCTYAKTNLKLFIS